LKDFNANPKLKTAEKKSWGTLICNTFGVRRVCWNFGMGAMANDKRVNYSYQLAQTKQLIN